MKKMMVSKVVLPAMAVVSLGVTGCESDILQSLTAFPTSVNSQITDVVTKILSSITGLFGG